MADPRDCPFVLGCEGGGTVVAVGPNTGESTALSPLPLIFSYTYEKSLCGAGGAGPSVGERVSYYCEGSYAEYSAVPAGLAAAVPDGLAMGDAVALTVQGLTAHYLTRSTVEV